MRIDFIVIIILLFFCGKGQAQNERKLTRQGNKNYRKEAFVDAEIQYKKALDKDNRMPETSFNLGNALLKQKRYDEASESFETAANLSSEEAFKYRAYYNQGNSNLEKYKNEQEPQAKMQALNKSIEAYKKALRNMPEAWDAKYNLSYALMERNKNQQNNQNQDNKDQENEKEKEEEKQQQEQEEQNKQGQQQQQKQQEQEQEISDEDAERILKALQNEESKVQEKLLRKKEQSQKIKIEKDW
jgi:Ca-activated chloride channel homolog